MQVSERVIATDEPCIVKTKQMADGVEDVVSLAQGIVHWMPPDSALTAAMHLVKSPSASSYGPAQGMPALREALVAKISAENGLKGVRTSPVANE